MTGEALRTALVQSLEIARAELHQRTIEAIQNALDKEREAEEVRSFVRSVNDGRKRQ